MLQFSLAIQSETKDNRIVVVDIGAQDIGVIVDAVTEVLRIPTSSIEPPASVITTSDSDYLLGIARENCLRRVIEPVRLLWVDAGADAANGILEVRDRWSRHPGFPPKRSINPQHP